MLKTLSEFLTLPRFSSGSKKMIGAMSKMRGKICEINEMGS
jgi:hypothetical protein